MEAASLASWSHQEAGTEACIFTGCTAEGESWVLSGHWACLASEP